MKSVNYRKLTLYTVSFFATLLVLASLASLIYDIPKWYLKILDFPRLLQFILSIILLVCFILLNRKWRIPSVALTAGLVAAVFIHFNFISPYLMGEKVVPDANTEEVNENSTVGILIANVLMTNKKADEFKQIIRNNNPDIILVMEVDNWWIDQLAELKESYPYNIEYPLENAYGMSFYSKFPLSDHEIKFLSHSRVPSFHTVIILPSGKKFNFHGLHPVAPFPSDKYPENIGKEGEDQEKEVELLKVGKLVAKNKLPTIVAGDFNDVAWSNTSRLFGQSGNLKDVRIGRGLNNTFNAQSFFMRWPLDHFFVTENITVLDFKLLPGFNSDHFPLYAKFVIQ